MKKRSRERRKAGRILQRILRKPDFLNVYHKMIGDLIIYGEVNINDYNFVFN